MVFDLAYLPEVLAREYWVVTDYDPAMDNEYVLYYHQGSILEGLPANLGIHEALKRTEDLRQRGKLHDVDTLHLIEDERFAAYLRATTPAKKNKNPIRHHTLNL